MSTADQFAADAASAGVAPTQSVSLADQFAADAAAGSKAAPSANPASAAGDSGAAAIPTDAGQQPGLLTSFGAGLGHGFGSTMLGAQQLIGRGAKAIGLDSAGNWLTQDAEHGLANLNAQYAPYSATHPVVAGTGNIVGQIAGTAPTMLAGPEYAGLSLAGKMGLGAAQGAAGSAMMPVQNPGDDFWKQKAEQVGLGGLLGGATPLVAAGARAAGQGLWNAIRPVVQPMRYVGEGLANAMDQAEAAQAASNIRGAQQFVPGSMPTTAQVAGSPVILQTEKAASRIPSIRTAMEQRAIDNNAARWNAINAVAQTPAALQTAEAARTATASPLYAAVNAASAPVDSSLTSLLSRPSVKSAMSDAVNLAADEGVQLSFPTAANQPISGQALDYLGRAMRGQIGVAQRSGNAQQVRAITQAANAIDQWGANKIPQIGAARQAYAKASVPINTMGAAQDIANTMSSFGRGANVNQQPVIQAGPYATALARAMNSQEYGIDPAAQTALENVGRDLQRATISNSLKSPGSDTAYNLAADGWLARNLYGPTFGGATPLGRGIAGGIVALGGHPWLGVATATGMGKLGKMVGGRLEDRLSGLLTDPNAILPFFDARAAAAAQQIPGPLMQGLLNYGRPAAVNGLLGGFQNPGNK